MAQHFLTRPPIVRPHKPIVCIAFCASQTLLALMIARGLPVRTHPLHPHQYVVPLESLSNSQIIELGDRQDFLYLCDVQFLTSPTGSNQTFNKPSTWNDSSNSIQLIAGGGSGGSVQRSASNTVGASGGGGGEYGKTTNFSFTGTTATYQIGAGGAAVNPTVGTVVNTAGNAGGDTWWNGATQLAATLGAKAGGAGSAGAVTQNGGAGGTGGVGTTHFAGGRGGNCSGNNSVSGGGGAGGTTAVGSNGVDETLTGATAGGAGGATGGGGGGAGSTTNGTPGGDGVTGTNFDATHGAGGGGGGWEGGVNSAQSGGAGGLYGGGSGGCDNAGSGGGASTAANTKAAGQGIIVVSWVVIGRFFSNEQNPRFIQTRQASDAIFVSPPAAVAPTSARGDFEQPRMVVMRRNDMNLAQPHRVPDPAPTVWSVPRQDYDQPRPLKILPQQEIFLRQFPQATGSVAPVFPSDQPVSIKIRPQFENAALVFLAQQLFSVLPSDVPVPIKTRSPLDTFQTPFTPAAVTAPPTGWWNFDQPVQIKARLQEDNLVSVPQVFAAATIMPTVFDEAYTQDIFIYDAVVTPVQPFAAVVVPPMSWQFDQPALIKVKVQFTDMAPQPFAAAQTLVPQPSDQPIVLKLRPSGEIATPAFTAPPTPSILGFQTFDNPPFIRIRPSGDFATWSTFTPAFVPPMAWISDQPIPLKIKPPAAAMIGEPVFVPPRTPTALGFQAFDVQPQIRIKPPADLAWTFFTPPATPSALGFQVFDAPALVPIRSFREPVSWVFFQPTVVAVPPMPWFFEQNPAYLKIKPAAELAVWPLQLPPVGVVVPPRGRDIPYGHWDEDEFIVHWLLMDDDE